MPPQPAECREVLLCTSIVSITIALERRKGGNELEERRCDQDLAEQLGDLDDSWGSPRSDRS